MCIDACPVGALTSGTYRYKTRPWEMNHVATVCTHCGDGCKTTLGVRRSDDGIGDRARRQPRQVRHQRRLPLQQRPLRLRLRQQREPPHQAADPQVQRQVCKPVSWEEALDLRRQQAARPSRQPRRQQHRRHRLQPHHQRGVLPPAEVRPHGSRHQQHRPPPHRRLRQPSPPRCNGTRPRRLAARHRRLPSHPARRRRSHQPAPRTPGTSAPTSASTRRASTSRITTRSSSAARPMPSSKSPKFGYGAWSRSSAGTAAPLDDDNISRRLPRRAAQRRIPRHRLRHRVPRRRHRCAARLGRLRPTPNSPASPTTPTRAAPPTWASPRPASRLRARHRCGAVQPTNIRSLPDHTRPRPAADVRRRRSRQSLARSMSSARTPSRATASTPATRCRTPSSSCRTCSSPRRPQLADVVLPAANLYEKSGSVTNSYGDLQLVKKAADRAGVRTDFELIVRLAGHMGTTSRNSSPSAPARSRRHGPVPRRAVRRSRPPRRLADGQQPRAQTQPLRSLRHPRRDPAPRPRLRQLLAPRNCSPATISTRSPHRLRSYRSPHAATSSCPRTTPSSPPASLGRYSQCSATSSAINPPTNPIDQTAAD